MLLEYTKQHLQKRVPCALPAPREIVRRVLHQRREHVSTRWSEVGIIHRRHGDLQSRLQRVLTVLRVVEGALQVLQGRSDQEPSALLLGCSPGNRGQILE